MRWRVWGLCAVLLAHMAVGAQTTSPKPKSKPPSTLPPSVQKALKAARLPASAMSVVVAPLNAQGQPLLSIGADRSINPASVMKLVTTYAAIDLLGPEHRWQTGFYTTAPVQRGVLQGDLYVRGGGDPKWVLERIQADFAALQNQGVRAIAGDLVLDHSGFDVPTQAPGDFDGEHLRPYNVTPDALLVNFKSVLLHFTPDPAAGVARVRSEPPLAGLTVDASVPLTTRACVDWRLRVQADFSDPNAIRLLGSYAEACGEQVWPVAYQDPTSYAARALEGLWRQSGGALTGRVRSGTTPTAARLLLAADSLPLSDIIADVNQFSNNVMAQQVFLSLATPTPRAAPDMTETPGRSAAPPVVAGFERSREVLARWWTQTFGSGVAAPVVDWAELGPKKMEYLVNGYFGTVGMWGLAVADSVVRAAEDKPVRPAHRLDDLPLIRAFYAEDPAKATVFESDVYKMRREVEAIVREARTLAKNRQMDQAKALMQEEAGNIKAYGQVVGGAKSLSALNQQISRVYSDPKLDADQKRAKVDALLVQKAALAQKVAKSPSVQAAF